ncbi:hypothetical protein [Deinococcus cavernae]|uniref:hypothetical protein n=1 Tax=Deinococcus cavernae TaxID=2320857 RepID=UPI001F1E31C2|nr:hypothetical protein [Deinococcus cavernae]
MASKVNSHRRALHEYAGEAGLTPELRAQIITFTAQTLARDSGGFISWDGFVLRNTQLGWAARLEPRWGGVESWNAAPRRSRTWWPRCTPLARWIFWA